MNRTGQFIEQQRRARMVTRSQLARSVGYENINRGARRITALERGEDMPIELVDRIIRALQLDEGYVHALMDEDRRAYNHEVNKWLDEPIIPELRFRALAAVWCRAQLPVDITRDDAIAYARDRAGTTGFIHFIRWSRREGWWCSPDGSVGVETSTVENANGPCSIVGGQEVIFG